MSVARALKFRDFVLDCQFLAFEQNYLNIVYGRMGLNLIKLALDLAVFPLQLFKMAGKRHEWCSLSGFLGLVPPTNPATARSGYDETMTVCHPFYGLSNALW